MPGNISSITCWSRITVAESHTTAPQGAARPLPADGRDQFDDGEHCRGLPGHRLMPCKLFLAADEAGDLRPVIEPTPTEITASATRSEQH